MPSVSPCRPYRCGIGSWRVQKGVHELFPCFASQAHHFMIFDGISRRLLGAGHYKVCHRRSAKYGRAFDDSLLFPCDPCFKARQFRWALQSLACLLLNHGNLPRDCTAGCRTSQSTQRYYVFPSIGPHDEDLRKQHIRVHATLSKTSRPSRLRNPGHEPPLIRSAKLHSRLVRAMVWRWRKRQNVGTNSQSARPWTPRPLHNRYSALTRCSGESCKPSRDMHLAYLQCASHSGGLGFPPQKRFFLNSVRGATVLACLEVQSWKWVR